MAGADAAAAGATTAGRCQHGRCGHSAARAPRRPQRAGPGRRPLTAVETVQADTAERTITVDNGLVRAVFSNRGATLSVWELLGYQGPDGKPVDLVPHDVPANQPKPFSLKLEDAEKTARINSALFAVTVEQAAGAVPSSLDARSVAGHAGIRISGRRRPARPESNSASSRTRTS